MDALQKHELDEMTSDKDVQQSLREIEDGETVESTPWKITDLKGADWAFRKIAALEKSNAENSELADADRERIDLWERSVNQANQDTIDFFHFKLAEYLQQLRLDDPKAKIKVPHGTVSTRKKPDSWEYSADAVEEIKKLGLSNLIKTTETVNKTDFKKSVNVTADGRVITENGEVVQSVKVVPQGETIVFKGVK